MTIKTAKVLTRVATVRCISSTPQAIPIYLSEPVPAGHFAAIRLGPHHRDDLVLMHEVFEQHMQTGLVRILHRSCFASEARIIGREEHIGDAYFIPVDDPQIAEVRMGFPKVSPPDYHVEAPTACAA